jgi:hypothetical protein
MRPWSRTAAALSALALVAVACKQEEAAPAPAPTPAPAPPVATPIDTTPPHPLDVPTTVIGGEAPTASDIPALLDKAGQYLKEGITSTPVGHRLNTPAGDCALDLYHQVLRLDPNNAQAKAGLGQIASFYQGKSRALLERRMASGAALLAEEGLRAEPDNAALKALLDQAKSGQ